jgi:predicted transcriptional regulator
VEQIAAKTGVTDRTVRRHLNATASGAAGTPDIAA